MKRPALALALPLILVLLLILPPAGHRGPARAQQSAAGGAGSAGSAGSQPAGTPPAGASTGSNAGAAAAETHPGATAAIPAGPTTPEPAATPAQTAEKAAKASKAGKAGKGGKGEKAGKDEKKAEPLTDAATYAGLELRGIGPAFISGRVADLAVDPHHHATYYVAVASGGVWKTTNAGTSFVPIFDDQGSYSIGCVTIDPNDSLVVWVGTGEYNSQRSVSYGDGVYRSVDGGRHWQNLGLKNSEHIARIVVDPRASDTVYVAAQGPLWAPGGDRGVYKTTDGGKTWKRILSISEETGVSDLVMDPRNPDVLYAASYQRRRTVWTLIDGGPESAIYKSRDAGATWQKLTNGLPKGDVGRIGLAIAAADPEVVYAAIEADREGSGFYRSRDAGANWEKRNPFLATSPQYYQRLIADPHLVDRVYVMDTFLHVTDDGGATVRPLGEAAKHVDNHALWIDPDDGDHLRNGCDGGVYESWDRGKTWEWRANLPLAQLYRADVDNALPFYNVYGGAQDNGSVAGPSRSMTSNGINNRDWVATNGGDGFVSRPDPEDSNIVYAQSQNGGIVRWDRKSGIAIDVQPQPEAGGVQLRFNWDSPMIISPFSHTRLYIGANRLYRSDDRGDSWRPVSPDLTRQLDRNRLKVMGRVWSVDAVAKNTSTSMYGNIVSLAESPRREGLLYVGTDDGLIQASDDGGDHWRKVEHAAGVPDGTYVANLTASRFDADTVFAAWDRHKFGDFKPYLARSADRGATWTSIAGDLPARGTVYGFAEDHVDRDLLFAGTEFGVYFTLDGGKRWVRLTGGMPTIAVRDLAIQRRENDLVLATFGRGFYILDDYTPLRTIDAKLLDQPAALFPVKTAPLYALAQPLGGRNKGFLGEAFYEAPNPPFGAVFTYYLKEELKSRRQRRRDAEAKAEKAGADVFYPSWDDLRAEAREQAPAVTWTVTDEAGHVIRRGTGPTTAGLHRVAWDLQFPAALPAGASAEADEGDFGGPPDGPLVAPGLYTVRIASRADGVETPLGSPQSFRVQPVGVATLPVADRAAEVAFERKVERLQRAALGAQQTVEETGHILDLIDKALPDTPAADAKMVDQAHALRERLRNLDERLSGNDVVARHHEAAPLGILARMQDAIGWGYMAAPTATQQTAYRIAGQQLASLLDDLRQLVEVDLKHLQDQLEAAGAPWTPGRVPVWAPE